jgi:hypothetical protein
MSLVVKDSSTSSFIPVPPGMHLARCYRIIDLGTQKSEYMGNVKNVKKVMIQFEVHSEDSEGNSLTTSDGKPMTMSKNYTAILAEKAALRKDLEAWRGKPFTDAEKNGFELKNILGQWAMITVGQSENNGKTYTNILNINPVPANLKKAGLPDGYNELKIFSIDEADMELFESFSDGLKDKIRLSPEWERLHGKATYDNGFTEVAAGGGSFDDMESDLPF